MNWQRDSQLSVTWRDPPDTSGELSSRHIPVFPTDRHCFPQLLSMITDEQIDPALRSNPAFLQQDPAHAATTAPSTSFPASKDSFAEQVSIPATVQASGKTNPARD